MATLADSGFFFLWTLMVLLTYLLVRERRRNAGLEVNFTFPESHCATMAVFFNSEPGSGPFITRATMLKPKTFRVSHEDDPEADGITAEAMMTECPFNFGKVYRTPIRFGIEAARAANGRLRIDIMTIAGRVLVSEERQFMVG